MLPDLARTFMMIVGRFSVRFYREIHSHDATSFISVREEFSHLFFFITKERFSQILKGDSEDRIIAAFREQLNDLFATHDASFRKDRFWEEYMNREETYATCLVARERSTSSVDESLLAAFTALLLTRISTWSRVVTHHSATVALESIQQLRGV